MRKTPRRKPKYHKTKALKVNEGVLPINTEQESEEVELDFEKISDIIKDGYPIQGQLFVPGLPDDPEKPFIVFGTDDNRLDYTGVAMAKTAGYELLSKFSLDQLNDQKLAGNLYSVSEVVLEDRYLYFIRLAMTHAISAFCRILFNTIPNPPEDRDEEFYNLITQYFDSAIIRLLNNRFKDMCRRPISDWVKLLQDPNITQETVNIVTELNTEAIARTSDLVNECYNIITLIAYRHSVPVSDEIYQKVAEEAAPLFIQYRNTICSILSHIIYECLSTYRIGLNNIIKNEDDMK